MFHITGSGGIYKSMMFSEATNSRALGKLIDNFYVYDSTGVLVKTQGWLEFGRGYSMITSIYSDTLDVRWVRSAKNLDFSRGDVFFYTEKSMMGEVRLHVYFPNQEVNYVVGPEREKPDSDSPALSIFKSPTWLAEGPNIMFSVADNNHERFVESGRRVFLYDKVREVRKPYYAVLERFHECYPDLPMNDDFRRFMDDFKIELKITKMTEKGNRK